MILMKKNIFRFFIVLIAFLIFSCNDDDYETPDSLKVSNFIWKGLNRYYLYQKKVDDLSDDAFKSNKELDSYLAKFVSNESLFNELLYSTDRFSRIVDDYEKLEASFNSVNYGFGIKYTLNYYKNDRTNLYGYVRYVVPGSPAESKSVSRGMVFNKINGTQITISNYLSLLNSNNTNYTVEFADLNDGNPVSNKTITLSKSIIQENPVAISKVIEENGFNIGYLLYNQFASNYDGELNAAFGQFKSQNIDKLIIDLRYNGGGSIRTTTYLGSMITGQFKGQVFSKEVWNEKITGQTSNEELFLNHFTDKIKNLDEEGDVILEEQINSLNLSEVHFIVSKRSASASELLINALKPYIDVKLVGANTYGKVFGSITLYDSNTFYEKDDGLNKDHKYAMQPIVLEIFNKEDENEPDGFIPGINIEGIFLGEDLENLGTLGERSDPLLKATLDDMTTSSKYYKKTEVIETHKFFDSESALPSGNNMYPEIKK